MSNVTDTSLSGISPLYFAGQMFGSVGVNVPDRLLGYVVLSDPVGSLIVSVTILISLLTSVSTSESLTALIFPNPVTHLSSMSVIGTNSAPFVACLEGVVPWYICLAISLAVFVIQVTSFTTPAICWITPFST